MKVAAAKTATPPRKRSNGELSRSRILAAALRLMSERGYAGTSLSDITRECGLPSSSIHHHFGSKEGVLDAILERRLGWLDEEFVIRPGKGSVQKRLHEWVSHALRGADDHARAVRMVLLLTLEKRQDKPQFIEHLRDLRRRSLAVLRDSFMDIFEIQDTARGRNTAADLAEFCLTYLQGVFTTHDVQPLTSAQLRTVARQLESALLHLAGEPQA